MSDSPAPHGVELMTRDIAQVYQSNPDMTDSARAERAYRALLAHYVNPGFSGDLETAFTEFLTDVRHEFRLHRNPGDFDCAIDAARNGIRLMTVKECAMRNASLMSFNAAYRGGQCPQEAWEDATNLELGEYPGNVTRARRAIAPWRYA